MQRQYMTAALQPLRRWKTSAIRCAESAERPGDAAFAVLPGSASTCDAVNGVNQQAFR
jgi:hypothetical protein